MFPLSYFPIVEALVAACIRERDCGTLQALRLCHPVFARACAPGGQLMTLAIVRCKHRLGLCGTAWCQCDCKSMRRHRIKSAVRNWLCSRHSACCTGYRKSDYRGRYRREVCADCFQGHWVNTGIRPTRLCYRETLTLQD